MISPDYQAVPEVEVQRPFEIWREKVDAVKLATITPIKVQDWKRRFIARAGDDPMKQRAARISFNLFVRATKSLFAPELVKHLDTVQLPDPAFYWHQIRAAAGKD